MEILIILPLVLLFILGLFWLVTYNGFITKRNAAKNAFSTIDVQLKKRWDLIPQLVSTTKGYAKHERELFESITEARNQAQQHRHDDAKRFKSEAQINQQLPRLMAVAEAYPELKADGQFELLQRNLTEVESQISAARRAYNASVTAYNDSLQVAPSNIIAGMHNFPAMELFSAKVEERENVTI